MCVARYTKKYSNPVERFLLIKKRKRLKCNTRLVYSVLKIQEQKNTPCVEENVWKKKLTEHNCQIVRNELGKKNE